MITKRMGYEVSCALQIADARIRTLVLLVERTVATPAAESVGLGVPLTIEGVKDELVRKSDRLTLRTRRRWYLCNIRQKHEYQSHRLPVSFLSDCTNLSSTKRERESV